MLRTLEPQKGAENKNAEADFKNPGSYKMKSVYYILQIHTQVTCVTITRDEHWPGFETHFEKHLLVIFCSNSLNVCERKDIRREWGVKLLSKFTHLFGFAFLKLLFLFFNPKKSEIEKSPTNLATLKVK